MKWTILYLLMSVFPPEHQPSILCKNPPRSIAHKFLSVAERLDGVVTANVDTVLARVDLLLVTRAAFLVVDEDYNTMSEFSVWLCQ
jgi:hypothetical protein